MARDPSDALPPFDWFVERIRKPDLVLGSAHAQWKETHNPFYVWMAIRCCVDERIEFPPWVREYLGQCAQRMLSPDAAEASDLRRVLPEIMGFGKKRGRGNQLNPDGDTWQYLAAAGKFGRAIVDGAKPRVALQGAFEALEGDISNIDDKTLLLYIKKIFELGNRPTPRTNAQWREVISAWMVQAFGWAVKEFRENPPRK